MGYEYRREVPIYLQLIDILRAKIIDGSYHAGDRLPPIRDLALEYEVTPNTIQRALAVFEQEGIILTERTNGKYITSNPEKIQEMRKKHLHHNMHMLVDGLLSSGYTPTEINTAFREEMVSNEESRHS